MRTWGAEETAEAWLVTGQRDAKTLLAVSVKSLWCQLEMNYEETRITEVKSSEVSPQARHTTGVVQRWPDHTSDWQLNWVV